MSAPEVTFCSWLDTTVSNSVKIVGILNRQTDGFTLSSLGATGGQHNSPDFGRSLK